MAKSEHGRPSREPYWRQVIARWKRSGLSVRAFCGAEGLNPMTFYWWRRELGRRDRPQPSFLQVHVLAEATEPSTAGIEVATAPSRSRRRIAIEYVVPSVRPSSGNSNRP